MLADLHLRNLDSFALIWLAALNLAAFGAFALDKRCAKRAAPRVPETTLVILGALGGWFGGVLAMNLFHHKTAKWSFKLKYALGLVPLAGAIWLWLRWR